MDNQKETTLNVRWYYHSKARHANGLAGYDVFRASDVNDALKYIEVAIARDLKAGITPTYGVINTGQDLLLVDETGAQVGALSQNHSLWLPEDVQGSWDQLA